ncbi:MAG TPA: NADH-quinone oxidoreductase subunit NuoN [Burkholderiales bacterium]|nr:NADH-quinone oxidoreductase subunit NuoN [Burkholderiales bacterium]
MTNLPNVLPALPEILMFSMACAILLIDLFLEEKQRKVSYYLAQLTLIGAAVLTTVGIDVAPVFTFERMFVDDALSDTLKLAIYVITFFAFSYSRDYLNDRGIFRGEYFVLGLFGVVGTMVMVSASHFLTLYLGLELLSLSLYAMIAFQRDSGRATEAAMKYFVLGAIASGMLLYGMSMLYGVTGTLEIAKVRATLAVLNPNDTILIFGLIFILVGVAFKLGVAPFHMWVPDVYHGAPTAVTVYIGTVPKVAAAVMLLRLIVSGMEPLSSSWQDMVIILTVLSMAIGNIVAIAQTNIKRMLAYSSISNIGFFLLGIASATPDGYSASVFYILVYAVMSLGAFGMVVLLSRSGFEAENLSDFRGLNQRSPWYAFLMLILMFSMAGVPPTAGFYAKLLVLKAVIGVNMYWLAGVSVLLAVIGAYYYLRVVKLMYFDDAEGQPAIAARTEMRWLISANALALLAIPWIGYLIDLCQRIVRDLA